jgi:hypothetical protein
VNANAREVLCAVLDHDSYALQHGCMDTRLQRAAIAYRNATTADAARSLKEDATRVEPVTTTAERAVLNEVLASAKRHCVDSEFWRHANAYLADIKAQPPQPDLAALNAAVAEAVEVYANRHPNAFEACLAPREFKVIVDANRVRRAAMQPKPRYTVEPNSTVPVRVVVYDTHESRPLSPPEVAALLNASVKP